MIPGDNGFRKSLREVLMRDNPYASHWVDAVTRTAYSIIESWRKRYLKGRDRKIKPRLGGGSLGANNAYEDRL